MSFLCRRALGVKWKDNIWTYRGNMSFPCRRALGVKWKDKIWTYRGNMSFFCSWICPREESTCQHDVSLRQRHLIVMGAVTLEIVVTL